MTARITGTRFNVSIGRKRGRSNLEADAARDMAGVIRNYRSLIKTMEDATPEVLFNALVPTYAKSKAYCPEDTGALKASGYLEVTSFRGIPTVEIGYGRGGVPTYTGAVHENMEWRHKEPTRAKWLQEALGEDAALIQRRITAAYKDLGF